jgi:hypothetical protein
MNEKNVHLFVVGEGDPELQQLLEKGLSEIGHECETTSAEAGPAAILDIIRDELVAVVIKPV